MVKCKALLQSPSEETSVFCPLSYAVCSLILYSCPLLPLSSPELVLTQCECDLDSSLVYSEGMCLRDRRPVCHLCRCLRLSMCLCVYVFMCGPPSVRVSSFPLSLLFHPSLCPSAFPPSLAVSVLPQREEKREMRKQSEKAEKGQKRSRATRLETRTEETYMCASVCWC